MAPKREIPTLPAILAIFQLNTHHAMTITLSTNGEFSLRHEVMCVSVREVPGVAAFGEITIQGEKSSLTYTINYAEHENHIAGIAKTLERTLHQHLLNFEARELEQFLS